MEWERDSKILLGRCSKIHVGQNVRLIHRKFDEFTKFCYASFSFYDIHKQHDELQTRLN